ncbi:ParM/StbA family protein, partial [Brunnivagina elsteri]
MVQIIDTTNNCQKVASQMLVSGKDLGAGFGKGLYGDKLIILPSAYLRVTDRNMKQHETISKDGCWVRYVEGDRKDLNDMQWFWGMSAINKDPKNYIKLHEDTKSKALYALESILADLAVLDIPTNTEVILSVSSHNPDKWSGDIRRNIEGTHTIEHLRNDVSRTKVQKNFTITLNDVYPEGFGAIAYCLFGGDGAASLELSESEVAIGLDFGTSTVIVTVFDGTGAVIDRNLIEGGSGELYQAIASTLDKSNLASNRMMRDTQHDVSLIRKGVESFSEKGKFIHGNSSLVGKPFTDEYWECFKTWLDSKIPKIANFASGNGYLDRAKYLACWGGARLLTLCLFRLFWFIQFLCRPLNQKI